MSSQIKYIYIYSFIHNKTTLTEGHLERLLGTIVGGGSNFLTDTINVNKTVNMFPKYHKIKT